MNYWLVKSEPDAYSWEQFVQDGQTQWTGVRNYAARLNLLGMKKGDEVLFYHSNKGKEVVGIGRVVKEQYPDYTATDGKDWVMVDLEAVRALAIPVTLETMKKDAILKDLELVRISRLSVCKVTKDQFDRVLMLSES